MSGDTTGIRTRITGLSCPDLCDFFGHTLVEAFGVDDKPLMGAPGDPVDTIVGFDGKCQFAPFDCRKGALDRHREAGWRSGRVVQIHENADALLAGPIEVRVDGVDTRPFYQSHHVAGGEHVRHFLKLGGFGKQKGNGLVFRDLVAEFKGQAGF